MPYYIKRTKAKKKDKLLPLFDKAGVTVKKKPDLKANLIKSSPFLSGFVMQCQTGILDVSRAGR